MYIGYIRHIFNPTAALYQEGSRDDRDGGIFGAKTELCYYLIPVYNSVQCMVGIFAFSASPVLILTAVAANLAVTGLGVFLLTRMFNSEGIMFSR